MRSLSVTILFSIFFNLFSFAQPRATFDYREFFTKEGSPYLELYFEFDPTSITPTFVNDSNVLFSLDLTILLEDSSEKILNYSKTTCNSPTFSTAAVSRFYFSTKMAIPENLENIEIILADSQVNLQFSFKFKPELKFNTLKNHVSQPLIVSQVKGSGLLQKGSKHLEVDLVKNFHSENDLIEFYVEGYSTDSSKQYAIKAILLENDEEKLVRFTKFKANQSPVSILMNFPLHILKNGDHSIKTILYNNNNQKLDSSSLDFNYYYNNKLDDINQLIIDKSFISQVNSIDSLDFLIHCLDPIADKIEKGKIRSRKKSFATIDDRKIFFYNFWEQRNKQAPDVAWQNYLLEVKKVNDNYSTPIKHGFETDRGRIYLQYGPPNSISDRPSEPESYPYQIWHYTKVDKFNNIRFVFYSSENATNDYQILHSDMPQEIKNPRWRVVLQSRNNKNPDMMNRNPGDSFGSRSQDLFTNPR